LETCQKAAMRLKKLSSVCLESKPGKGHEFDVEGVVECMRLFINNGKLRSVSFKIDTDDTGFENAQLWRQKLMQHPEVKKWSKVTRVRCEML